MEQQLTATSTVPSTPPPPSPAPPATNAASAGWPAWFGAALILASVLIVYLPVLPSGIIWDDDQYLTNPPHHRIAPKEGDDRTRGQLLKEYWTTTATPQYYPLVFTSYWLEYHTGIGRFNPKFDASNDALPKSYHVVNILLHAAAALVLWRILLFLRIPGAWVIAMVFALHPIQVETVSWVTERKNTLSGLFYMIALLAYLKFGEGRSWGFYALSLAAFVLALFSKTVTSTLPIVILLLFWLRGRRVALPRLAALAPFLILGVFMGRLTAWYEFHKEKPEYWKPMPITRAVGLAWTEKASDWQARSGYKLTGSQRVMIASRSLLHYTRQLLLPWPTAIDARHSGERGLFYYVRQLVLPKPLAFFYDRWDESDELAPDKAFNFWPVAVVVAVAAAVVVLSVVLGRGVFVGVAFFVITIFPALGFFDTWPMRYSFVADHFAYLACIGLIALVVGALAVRLGRVGVPSALLNGATPAGAAVAAVVIVCFAAAANVRARAFDNEETLWLDTLAKTPTAWAARINLGRLYGSRGNAQLAAQRDAQKKGDHPKATEAARAAAENLKKAAAQFQAIIDGKGRFIGLAYENLGNIRALQERWADAEVLFRKAIHEVPRNASLYKRLGNVLMEQKKYRAAANAYCQAIQLDPNDASLVRAEQRALARAAESGEPAVATAATRPGAAPAQPALDLDFTGANTPQERRNVYLRAIAAAMARRDYLHARAVLNDAMREPDNRNSLGLWKKTCWLIAASPIDAQRNPTMAVQLAEKLQGSIDKNNTRDAEVHELLGIAYAGVGRFDDALKAAERASQVAEETRNTDVGRRVAAQIALYKAKTPYRLPPPITATAPAAGTTTRPAVRPITVIPLRPMTAPATATQPG